MGQKLHLKITSDSQSDLKTIDSIGYSKKHSNAKSIVEEANSLSEKLKRFGFLENEIQENKKQDDSTFLFKFRLGQRTRFIHIYLGKDSELRKLGIVESPGDTLKLPLGETESFLNTTLNSLERKGYSLARLQLINLKKQKNILLADLNLQTEKQRQVNDIVINGYEKFPEGHKKEIRRRYRNKVFNQQNLKNIHEDFNQFQFVTQTKYPEILFMNDTTKVYVYLEKSKPNRFDGFIGFGNDDKGDLKINGYLDLLLVNSLNVGERFNLYWKSDGNDQKTFNANIELPYIFRSPLGIKAQLNIFKQDSTFQNTQTAIDLGYYFNYNTRLYVGYQSTESNDIQNLNSSTLKDFDNAFITSNFEYTRFKNDDFLFPDKTLLNIKAGVGNRNSEASKNSQFFTNVDLRHNLYLNDKNIIALRSQNFLLQSDSYITNELFRFGGINSIRGFNENSLQANLYSSILTEYRYVLAPTIYIHSIIDFGYYQDKTTDNDGNLLGLGFGFGLLTKNGLFNIVYANGSTGNQQIKLSNSIVHISFKAKF
ncbi:hypothetical protein [Flavobacterium lindanitolerans]|uniref:Outer membrane translocation and assembly module TamA n=1 Tax=Flavobacterium lindanitolerans TaxID=428988 RepID=A0A497U5P1_9FLAO|nr:hypothetical protein [Flavobacterium lindanitolerans]PKW20365.1 outer membrane translocation and assembly module TamA [Flavobacterium lindanitolerans]RLJ23678.1 outer membrane translocation and assembly module TamA [Flavobacterium lindanitolerans]